MLVMIENSLKTHPHLGLSIYCICGSHVNAVSVCVSMMYISICIVRDFAKIGRGKGGLGNG